MVGLTSAQPDANQAHKRRYTFGCVCWFTYQNRAVGVIFAVMIMAAVFFLYPSVDKVSAQSTEEYPEWVLFDAINVDRAAHGLAPLNYSLDLAYAAFWYSEVLVGHLGNGFYRTCWSHYCPPVPDPNQRAALFGYDAFWAGDALTVRQNAGEAFQAVVASPPHHAAVLSPYVQDMGIGRTYWPPLDSYVWVIYLGIHR